MAEAAIRTFAPQRSKTKAPTSRASASSSTPKTRMFRNDGAVWNQFESFVNMGTRLAGAREDSNDADVRGSTALKTGTLLPGQTIQLLPAEDSRIAYPCRVVWTTVPRPGRLSEAGLEFKTPWTVSRHDFSNTVA